MEPQTKVETVTPPSPSPSRALPCFPVFSVAPRAIEVNINIMRAFVRMRQYILSHTPKEELEELRKRIEYLEEDVSADRDSYEKQFDGLFSALPNSTIQMKNTAMGRVEIKGFRKDDNNFNNKENECEESK